MVGVIYCVVNMLVKKNENCNEIKNEIKKNIPVARDVSRLESLLLLLCCLIDPLRWPGVWLKWLVCVVVTVVVEV